MAKIPASALEAGFLYLLHAVQRGPLTDTQTGLTALQACSCGTRVSFGSAAAYWMPQNLFDLILLCNSYCSVRASL